MDFRFMLETQEAATQEAPEPAPQKPEPQIPPPCWDSREISADACRAATKAMCG